MRNRFKTQILRAATSAPMAPVHRRLTGDSVAVFMLHRFGVPDLGVAGHSPATIADFLEWIRRRGIRTWSLHDLAEAVVEGRPLGGGVCFTVDDAYADFAIVGVDVFEAYDCPVTVFLPTDFVDQRGWMWWDQIAHMVNQSSRPTVPHPRTRVGNGEGSSEPAPLSIADGPGRRRASSAWKKALKPLSATQRDPLVERLAGDLDVNVPTGVPVPEYRAMTWDSVRECGRSGLARYGPHTVSHPWMPALSREEIEQEIGGSWRRLRAEVDQPVPVFCFPYGTAEAVPMGVDDIFRREGLVASVTAEIGIVGNPATGLSAYGLPRIGWDDDLLDARQVSTGILGLRERGVWSALRELVGRQ